MTTDNEYNDIMNRLEKAILSRARSIKTSTSETDSFDVEAFVYKLDLSSSISMDKDFLIYDRLCKKLDVVKKLYTEYTKDLRFKASETHASSNLSTQFLINLMYLSLVYNDLKFLNSLNKIKSCWLKNGIISLDLVRMIEETNQKVISFYESN